MGEGVYEGNRQVKKSVEKRATGPSTVSSVTVAKTLGKDGTPRSLTDWCVSSLAFGVFTWSDSGLTSLGD